jgi:aryl-alcohol dehydrogenase
VGATHTIDAAAGEDVVTAIRDITSGGADFSVETSAVPDVAAQAVDSLAKRGTCAILGLGPSGTRLSTDMTGLLTSGRTITGVTMGDGRPADFVPALVELHRQGRFPVDRLVTAYPLDAINEAIADAEAGHVVKAVLVP